MLQLKVIDFQEVQPGVVLLSMRDKVHKNTLTAELIDDLQAAFSFVSDNPKYKAVVLTGYDSYFCCGGTKDGLMHLHETDAQFTDVNIYGLALECNIPVISAMQGHGIGGGLVLGLYSDFVVMSRESIYSANFMKYGFTPGMGATYIVPKKLGTALGQELLFTAGNYRGAEFEKRGIGFSVLPRSEVLPKALELAGQLAEKPRLSLVTLKKHLVQPIIEELHKIIDQELAMHDKTFHQPEVRDRINELFGS